MGFEAKAQVNGLFNPALKHGVFTNKRLVLVKE